MELLINNPAFLRRLIRRRRATGADRFDEVWDGVYIVSPVANNEHQSIAFKFSYALETTIGLTGLGQVFNVTNVSDRENDWRKNYRCPDVAVFLKGTAAIDQVSHWLGGPDFVVEIISRHDRSRRKFDFYAKVGVKELLLVDRKPWALELYQLQGGVLVLVGKSDLDHPNILASAVVPLSFRLVPGDPRPTIAIAHADGVQLWSA